MATFKVLLQARYGIWQPHNLTLEQIKEVALRGIPNMSMSITVLGPDDGFPPAADLGVLVFQSDYAAWAADLRRAKRLGHAEDFEYDFGLGCWYIGLQDDPSGYSARYRVSWNSRTGELYARELDPQHPHDRFAVLAVLPTLEEAQAAMEGWAEGDHDLLALVSRLAAR